MPKPRDVFKAIRHFVGNLARDPFLPKDRRWKYFQGWLVLNYRYANRHPRIPVKSILEICPDAGEVTVAMEVCKNAWNITPTELYILSLIAWMSRPRRIFEFGTYDGATTYQLARSFPTAEIYTIDFSPQPEPHFHVGSRYQGTDEARRICQLYGDTTKFDFSPYNRQMDFIFIDGGHEYEVVKSDTTNALRMIRPGGVIVWDDYAIWPGVKRAVEELVPGYAPIEVMDTKFALLWTEPTAEAPPQKEFLNA